MRLRERPLILPIGGFGCLDCSIMMALAFRGLISFLHVSKSQTLPVCLGSLPWHTEIDFHARFMSTYRSWLGYIPTIRLPRRVDAALDRVDGVRSAAGVHQRVGCVVACCSWRRK
ncbi:hypothetical protein B0T22DRAFT_31229 [Podospora appendiculata]|uniref:Uncharacterized protein n=1 Tax=Podospora appendiculata TaxID=314037 RepID=A0AAE0XGF8_9PEZI|nr:hypothetical protein B0T22DRAFT_31229 [Podospora appendiculata]